MTYIKIILNNQELIINDNISINELLESNDMKCYAAIWINGDQLMLKEYETQAINENDNIKVLRIVGGG